MSSLVQLHIALLGTSLGKRVSHKDIEKHLNHLDLSYFEDTDNPRLLVWLGKLNKLLGASVVAHWVLEARGHYFELRKTSLLQQQCEFRKGVPIDSVKWDRKERIYQSYNVGWTDLTVEQINAVGKQFETPRL